LNDSDLIHMNGRVYDYNLGRFLSVDPFIQAPSNSQSLNPYSYIMNNPLSGIDPTGYIAIAPLIPIAGKILSGIGAFAGGYSTGKAIGEVARGEKTAGEAAKQAGTEIAIEVVVTAAGVRIVKFADDIPFIKKRLDDFVDKVNGNDSQPSKLDNGQNPSDIKSNERRSDNESDSQQRSPEARKDRTGSDQLDDRTANDPLRRDQHGNPTPDPEAQGTAHTQLGTRDGKKEQYGQGREFDPDDNEVKRIDFTDHGRSDHPNPHQHRPKPNETGGTPKGGDPEPLTCDIPDRCN